MKKLIKALLFISVFSLLQGCATGVIIVAGSAVAVGNDERSIPEQLDDSLLTLAAKDEVKKLNLNDQNIRINLVSNSGNLLVIGQVTDQATKFKIEEALNGLYQAKAVYNQLRIGKPIGFAQQTKDSWITTKVKSQLGGNNSVNPLKIKVITEDSEVFLIGKVTQEMARDATNITRKIDGVKRVNRVFQLID